MSGGSQPNGRTVVRQPPRQAVADDPLPALAKPLLDIAVRVERSSHPNIAALIEELRAATAAFEIGGQRAGLTTRAIVEARDAVLSVVLERARANPGLDAQRFAQALYETLPASIDTRHETLAARRAAAEAEGPGQRPLARFLGHCQEALETVQSRAPQARPRSRSVAFAVACFLVLVAGWAAWAEWSYRERLLARLPVIEAHPIDMTSPTLEQRARSLDVMQSAVLAVEGRAGASPLGIIHRIPTLDPAEAARARYGMLADSLLLEPLAEAVTLALATEGDALTLYDSLRAWAILTGAAPLQPQFLTGWLRDRTQVFPELVPVLPHVGMLTRPNDDLEGLDPHLLAEARRFAADGAAEARAFLELARSPAAAALPAWSPATTVPGIEAVLIRRSGLSLDHGFEGLYTERGWSHAGDGGAAAAIAEAARESERLLGVGDAAAPEAVLDELQARTIDAWTRQLSDLRVRPFVDQPSALMLTGRLAALESPLELLFRSVWREVGGEDRGRSHRNQLLIAAAFGPVIQFVEQGRMQEISRVFASLNVALQALDHDTELGRQRLMDARARTRSLAALQHAPALVMQVIEDVLAQTAAADAGQQRVGATWQREIAPACRAAVDGRYPFADGPDADLDELVRVLGPEGVVIAFFREHLAAMVDDENGAWRWKPEGLLAGFRPESLHFFERVNSFGAVVLREAAGTGHAMSLTAIAQNGVPSVSVGGVTKPVQIDHRPVALAWPGPEPDHGFAIAIATSAGTERIEQIGPFGFLRFLDGLRLRPREEGRRFLVDVRLESARAYFQMDFEGPLNAVMMRQLVSGLTCPLEL
jgi:type VI protein secretion system component VasK